MERLKSIVLGDFFDLTEESICILTTDGTIQKVNTAFERMVGVEEADLLNKKINELVPECDIGKITASGFRDVCFKLNGTRKWLSFSLTPLKDMESVCVIVRDITEFKIQQRVLKLENDVFEMNASLRYSLNELMNFFLHGIGEIYPEMKCCIMLLDTDTEYLSLLSSPSLPKAFIDAFKYKVKIGPSISSCGAAAYLKHPVIVADISTHPNWQPFKDIALKYDLRSCWSFPLIDDHGETLGTFDIFNTYIKEPSEEDRDFIQLISRTIQVLLENHRTKENLTISNERYRLVTLATNDAVWDHDVTTGKTFWGEGFARLFGLDFNSEPLSWESRIHKNDRKRVLDSLEKVRTDPNQHQWHAEYRYRKADNTYAYVVDYGFVIRGKDKKAIRMVGAMQDITKIKKHELQILRQNQKLREIAQINSHQIRKPLANILGLINLMESFESNEYAELLMLLQESGTELDTITRKIARKSIS